MLLFHKVLLLYQLYILRIEPVHKDSFDCIRSKIDEIEIILIKESERYKRKANKYFFNDEYDKA